MPGQGRDAGPSRTAGRLVRTARRLLAVADALPVAALAVIHLRRRTLLRAVPRLPLSRVTRGNGPPESPDCSRLARFVPLCPPPGRP